MKKFFAILLTVFILFMFADCNSAPAKVDTEDKDITPDNTAASLVHDPIYYYKEGNVPYDADNDCYAFCFMTPYLAAKPTGGAVVIFPGGGYNHLSNSTSSVDGYGQGVDNLGDQKESSDIAEWYNSAGISVFVVNYRTTAVDPQVCYKHILSDGLRAVRYVRVHAADNYIDPDKIAVQGWSAGGHLAAMLLTKYDWQVDDPDYVGDNTDLVSAKPNAGVLCYPVISMQNGLAHSGTRKVFTGNDAALYDMFSAEKNVTADTPPCFIWCHQKDGSVKSDNSYAMATALDQVNVYNEIYVFDDGGTTKHGVGTAQEFEEAKAWPEMATKFLKDRSF